MKVEDTFNCVACEVACEVEINLLNTDFDAHCKTCGMTYSFDNEKNHLWIWYEYYSKFFKKTIMFAIAPLKKENLRNEQNEHYVWIDLSDFYLQSFLRSKKSNSLDKFVENILLLK